MPSFFNRLNRGANNRSSSATAAVLGSSTTPRQTIPANSTSPERNATAGKNGFTSLLQSVKRKKQQNPREEEQLNTGASGSVQAASPPPEAADMADNEVVPVHETNEEIERARIVRLEALDNNWFRKNNMSSPRRVLGELKKQGVDPNIDHKILSVRRLFPVPFSDTVDTEKTSSFLASLPAEIRLIIYEYLIGTDIPALSKLAQSCRKFRWEIQEGIRERLINLAFVQIGASMAREVIGAPSRTWVASASISAFPRFFLVGPVLNTATEDDAKAVLEQVNGLKIASKDTACGHILTQYEKLNFILAALTGIRNPANPDVYRPFIEALEARAKDLTKNDWTVLKKAIPSMPSEIANDIAQLVKKIVQPDLRITAA